MKSVIEQVYEEFGKRFRTLGVHKENINAGRFYEKHGLKRTGVYEGNDEYYSRLI